MRDNGTDAMQYDLKHKGRLAQLWIYLQKFLRMFVYQNDWKVLPMGAAIAALVTYVIGANLFVTQEGTAMGCFAIVCVCIWNGFFNSIQVICRERPIIKREHRSGMHISSYIAAHMIYQAFLCLCQSYITLQICMIMKVSFPAMARITPWPVLDIGITLFLTTYAADMMALMVSAFVHNTTTAMTIMPFLLIFQLVFSGGFIQLDGFALKLCDFTVAKWGLTSLCAQADYNHLPMVSLWNSAFKLKDIEVNSETTDKVKDAVNDEIQDLNMDEEMVAEVKDILVSEGIDLEKELNEMTAQRITELLKQQGLDIEIEGQKPVWEILHYIEVNGMKEGLLLKSAEFNQNPNYEGSTENIIHCWSRLLLFIVIFSCLSVASLEYIDKDKR